MAKKLYRQCQRHFYGYTVRNVARCWGYEAYDSVFSCWDMFTNYMRKHDSMMNVNLHIVQSIIEKGETLTHKQKNNKIKELLFVL